MSHIESNIGDITTTDNDIIDTQDEQVADNKWFKNKRADIEVRSRCNNLKICGVTKSVQNSELSNYVQSMIKTLLPDL